MQQLHEAWSQRLIDLTDDGNLVSPRGLPTYEQLGVTVGPVDAARPLLVVPARKLAYRFAVAEWLWIWFGHSDVETIARYNPVMSQFSDDGIFLAGAYGPHIHGGWMRMVEKFRYDANTRQAVIQIPRPRDTRTKDEPCTLSVQFIQRNGKLHAIATMRSSDVWLGLPYDCFTFMQLQNILAGVLELERGWFQIQLGSSHLYQRDADTANKLCYDLLSSVPTQSESLFLPQLPGEPPSWLDSVLVSGSLLPMPTSEAKSPWARYAYALVAPSNSTALYELRRD
jgi:hypothetical protein